MADLEFTCASRRDLIKVAGRACGSGSFPLEFWRRTCRFTPCGPHSTAEWSAPGSILLPPEQRMRENLGIITVRSDPVLGAESDRKTRSAPPGFCPSCDYPTDVGICPECGLHIPARWLRNRPKSWLHRNWRGVAVSLCTIAALVWFANARIDWIKLFPTSYLLSIQASDSGSNEAASEELTRRYLAGSLNAEQTRSFIREGAEIRWNCRNHANENPLDPDGRRVHSYLLSNKLFVPSSPLWHNRTKFSIKETILEIRADDHQVLIMTSNGSEADDLPLVAFCGEKWLRSGGGPRFRSRPKISPSFIGTRIQLINREAACGMIEIDTQVVVVDAKTQKVITQWQMTYTVVPRDAISPIEAKSGTNAGNAAPQE